MRALLAAFLLLPLGGSPAAAAKRALPGLTGVVPPAAMPVKLSVELPSYSVPAMPPAAQPAVPGAFQLPVMQPLVVEPSNVSFRVPGREPIAAYPTLQSVAQQPGPRDAMGASHLATAHFDGAKPVLEPAFEPPTSKTPAPLEPADGAGNGAGANNGGDDGQTPEERKSLSFPPAQLTHLMERDPKKAVYGAIKRVRPWEGSRTWWKAYKRGLEIDVKSRGSDVFGRPTTITSAVTKKIGQLTREDFKGVVPGFQLQAPIRELRKALMNQLEEARKRFNENDPPVTAKTDVRVVKFKSFLQLFKEANGKDAIPPIETPAPRVPLKIEAKGKLEPLSRFLPRAVFLDVDALEGPISTELLSDMMKLQRTGVYFVAFSRLPYAASGGMREKLIAKMSSYQLSILMPIRFMAVTDDGALVSSIGKNGNLVPAEAAEFTSSELELLRDAAQKSGEEIGLSPRSLRERAQPPLEPESERGSFTRAARKAPPVAWEMLLPKGVPEAALKTWTDSFNARLAGQGVDAVVRVAVEDGKTVVRARKTDLTRGMPRVLAALGDQFGLYLNPSDLLVLSDDKSLLAANPHLDFSKETGLKGAELVENGLGLLLGEHRESREGDLAGSASRMAQFSGYRHRYLAEFLIKQDNAEQNINFFSGHTVHSANDWLVWKLQNGVVPTRAEYSAELRRRWDAGLREFKPVGLPEGESMEGWIRESTQRGLSMYDRVLEIHKRGEVLVGTEIPNFFMVKDYQRRSGDLKRRYVLHTIFDFVALRPIPGKPGHATVVIYDFKTGPAQSRQKLEKDLQVLTYAYFANARWVGKTFGAPYFAGDKKYVIDDAQIEFIYNAIAQPTTITNQDLDWIRRKIVGTLNRIHASEQRLLGAASAPKKRPAKGAKAAKGKKPAKKSGAK